MKRVLFFMFLVMAVLLIRARSAEGPVVSNPYYFARSVVSLIPQVEINLISGATKTILGHLNYSVKPGDNLWSLAREFRLDEWMIREANPRLSDTLYPGEKIRMPLIKWKKYQGYASWYGPGFHKRRTASGERYDMYKISCAHRSYPLGTKLRLTNLENGRTVIAEVTDRGPFVETWRREVDVSFGAAVALGAVREGVFPVTIEPLNDHLAKWVGGYDKVI